MFKPLSIFALVLAVCLVIAFAAPALRSQTPAAAPDTAKSNPVKPTPESLASGKKWYGYDCAMCHGAHGDGKGEVAVDEKLTLSDLSDPATLKNMNDGELYSLLKNGKGKMPPENDRLKGNEMWNLINYVRSLSNQKTS